MKIPVFDISLNNLLIFPLLGLLFSCSSQLIEKKYTFEDTTSVASPQNIDNKIDSQRSGRDTILAIDSRDKSLWKETVSPWIAAPLWINNPYDSGHFLMLPLHAAFASKYQPWIDEFDSLFKRFTEDYLEDDRDDGYLSEGNKLARLHFLYLASEYLVLLNQQAKPVPKPLLQMVLDSLEYFWQQPAWLWDRDDFDNVAERLKWKLSHKQVSKSYYRAIFDHELFAFAIAANLKSILGNDSPKLIDDILDLAYKVLEQEIKFIDDNSEKWLLQPGVWTDHPEYAYAGWDDNPPNLPYKKPVPGIAQDTSHFHRWPLWLISFQRGFAAQKQPARVKYILKLRRGLAEQFKQKVLVPPSEDFPNYRTTNFMDGLNGVYRYKYHRKTNPNWVGYGPYELSGTMLMGWWAFLPKNSMEEEYCFMASSYPLSNKERILYRVPETTKTSFFNIYELIDRIACKLIPKKN